jgi:hypothetical protein
MKNLLILTLGLIAYASESGAVKCDRDCKTNRNKANAQAWCAKQVEECIIDNKRGCGSGWKQVYKFDEGGDSWFACFRTFKHSQSDSNRDEANQYCNQNHPIGTCFPQEGGCGSGLKSVKAFRGKGRNYHACVKK